MPLGSVRAEESLAGILLGHVAAPEHGRHPPAGESRIGEERGHARGAGGLHHQAGGAEEQAHGPQDGALVHEQHVAELVFEILERFG